ncbi:MAG TPA: hypothetical protein VK923_02785 [Euzebyales bacterium]|nr:hypothetical protein [Euzebyales bacterium]
MTSLIALSHPEVAMHADAAAVAMGAASVVEGASGVAAVFSGRALGAQVAAFDDIAGLGHDIGDPIRIDRAGLGRLANAYFAEIVARYT